MLGSAGDTFLTFAGGTLAPDSSCTFSVTLVVPSSAAPGPHTNTTSDVTAMVGVIPVTGNPASDDLRIVGLTLTKEFLDDPVIPGETVTLEFVIENVHPTETATFITIFDDMATILGGSPDITGDGVTVSDVCGPGNGTVTWSFGDTFMTFSGGTLAPGEMCPFSVTLVVPGGAAFGTYANATASPDVSDPSGFSAIMSGSDVFFDDARDDLQVVDPEGGTEGPRPSVGGVTSFSGGSGSTSGSIALLAGAVAAVVAIATWRLVCSETLARWLLLEDMPPGGSEGERFPSATDKTTQG